MANLRMKQLDPQIKEIANDEWRSFIEPLLPLGEWAVSQMQEPENPQLRHELYRETLGSLVAGYFALVLSDPDNPRFVPNAGQDILNVLGTNPDYTYFFTLLDDKGTYKISGYRGTSHSIVFQFMTGYLVPRGEGDSFGKVLSHFETDDLEIGDDGFFEFILSAERPKDYQGDWLKLPKGTTHVLLRYTVVDWLNEVDGRLAIERLDRNIMKPRPTVEEISEKLKGLAPYVKGQMKTSFRFTEPFRQQVPANSLGMFGFGEDGGMVTQTYMEGLFDLKADEALILETELPERCKYWAFQITDDLWAALDWQTRQTSLNYASAKLDYDGKFRAVISSQDPGVPNWLDTVGRGRGIIQGRWRECSSTPKPTMTKVKLNEVRRHLPVDTPVITPEERELTIRQRNRGAQFRRLW